MKTIIKLLPVLLVLTIACGGDDPNPVAEPTTLDKLQGTWNLSSVTRDGADVTSGFTGFKLVIANTNYTITNGGTAWLESSGTLSISGDNATSVDSMGGINNIALEFSNGNNTLKLTYAIDTTVVGGRTTGLVGNYVFVLTKQ